jgi:hypothetical protein
VGEGAGFESSGFDPFGIFSYSGGLDCRIIFFRTDATPFTISSSAIPQFDPSLRTLTSIQFVFSGTAAGTVAIANDSSRPGNLLLFG